MSTQHKLEIIDQIGIDLVYIIPFTKPFSKVTANDFLNETILPFYNPKYMIVGYDHHFGHKREGNIDFIRLYSKKRFKVHLIKKQINRDKTVS